jgi:hypothetical protein
MFYTKAVLSIIAVSLLILCVENLVLSRSVLAQPTSAPQKVMLVDSHGNALNVVSGNLGMDIDAAVPVTVNGATFRALPIVVADTNPVRVAVTNVVPVRPAP